MHIKRNQTTREYFLKSFEAFCVPASVWVCERVCVCLWERETASMGVCVCVVCLCYEWVWVSVSRCVYPASVCFSESWTGIAVHVWVYVSVSVCVGWCVCVCVSVTGCVWVSVSVSVSVCVAVGVWERFVEALLHSVVLRAGKLKVDCKLLTYSLLLKSSFVVALHHNIANTNGQYSVLGTGALLKSQGTSQNLPGTKARFLVFAPFLASLLVEKNPRPHYFYRENNENTAKIRKWRLFKKWRKGKVSQVICN